MVANIQSQLTRNYVAGLNLSDSVGGLDSVINSPYSMNSGILGFNGGMGYFGPGPEVKTMSQYLTWQEETQGAQLDSQRRLNEKSRISGLLSNASEDTVSRQIGILHDQIANNEQDKVAVSITDLRASVKKEFEEAGYTNVPDDKINSAAEKLYFEATGTRLVDDIKGKGDCAFVHGLKQGAFGLGWLLDNRTSAVDNATSLTGEQVNKLDQFGNVAGIVVSSGASLVALPFVLKGGKMAAIGIGSATKNSWLNLFGKGSKNASKNVNLAEMLSKLIKDPKELESVLKVIAKR